MKAPENIISESDWQKYCTEKGYTNNGTTGWFNDHMGCLHYWENFQNPTVNDLRRQKHAEGEPYDYYSSEFYIAKPWNLLIDFFNPEYFKRLSKEDLTA